MKKIVLLSFAVFLLAGVLVVSGCTKNGVPSGKYDTFAQCLTDKGVKMYGAYWCSHCKEQKDLFGDSSSKVTYVECADQGSSATRQVCKDAGVESFPTWIFPDNSRLVGAQSLEDLAAKSGCTLPSSSSTNATNTANANVPAENANANVNATNSNTNTP